MPRARFPAYYRDKFKALGVHPEEIRSFEDFASLPILTKTDIRAHGAELLSERYDRATLTRKMTSGSTGVSLEVFVDEVSQQHKQASHPAARTSGAAEASFPASLSPRCGAIPSIGSAAGAVACAMPCWSARRTWTLSRWTRARWPVSPPDCAAVRPRCYSDMRTRSILLAEYCSPDRGIRTIRPRGIIATAMVLHTTERQAIEEVFACPVTNRYGCEEVSLIACECERHDGLHVNADGVYVELLREGQPVSPGEPGSVVATDLTNRAMPLLRYQVGDVAVWSGRACPCGRGLPLLERIEGREADYVVTAAGELISGISLTENFALHVPGVVQIQIVQEEILHFVFRIVRGPDFGPASLRRLRELVAERFGPDVAYVCEYPESIPQEASGKYRFCVSRVENPFTRPREGVVA